MLDGRRRKDVSGPKPAVYNRDGKLPVAVQRALLDEAEKLTSAYGRQAVTVQALAAPAHELLPVRAGGGKPGRQPSQKRRVQMQLLQKKIFKYMDLLMSRVEKTSPTGCWLWKGRTRVRGGRLQLLTVNPTSKNLNCARRAVANLCGFKPQPRITLKVTCGDELCVQPLHLIARA